MILVYDVSSRISFDKLTYWLTKIRDNCSSDVVLLLIGNKIDKERQVGKDEGSNYAK